MTEATEAGTSFSPGSSWRDTGWPIHEWTRNVAQDVHRIVLAGLITTHRGIGLARRRELVLSSAGGSTGEPEEEPLNREDVLGIDAAVTFASAAVNRQPPGRGVMSEEVSLDTEHIHRVDSREAGVRAVLTRGNRVTSTCVRPVKE